MLKNQNAPIRFLNPQFQFLWKERSRRWSKRDYKMAENHHDHVRRASQSSAALSASAAETQQVCVSIQRYSFNICKNIIVFIK